MKTNFEHSKHTNIDLILKIVAIVAPFVLAFWLLNIQSEKQRIYEKEKLRQLVIHLSAEIDRNSQLVKDSKLVPGGMYTKIELLIDSSFVSKSPPLRFKMIVWETAISKDYFFLLPIDLYNKVAKIYDFFSEYNHHAQIFSDIVKKIKVMPREIYNLPNYEFEAEYKNAQYNSISANHYLDNIVETSDVIKSDLLKYAEELKR